MKSYDQLTREEQERAEELCTTNLLEAITEGAVRFSDEKNGDDLQARIDAAGQKAEDMQTPWFASEYIMEAAGEEIAGMAQCDAEDHLYAEPGERVLHGVVEDA